MEFDLQELAEVEQIYMEEISKEGTQWGSEDIFADYDDYTPFITE